MVVAGFLCQYKKESQAKNTTYECGLLPFEDARIKFDIKYFNYALLFLIFDVEGAVGLVGKYRSYRISEIFLNKFLV